MKRTNSLFASYISFTMSVYLFFLFFLTMRYKEKKEISGFKVNKLAQTEFQQEEKSESTFEKTESKEDILFTYKWKDYQDEVYNISFSLSKKSMAEAEAEFGYFEDELKKFLDESLSGIREEMISYLKRIALQLIAESKYPQYFLIEQTDPKNFKIKISVPPSLYEEVKPEYMKISNKIKSEQISYLKKIENLEKKLIESYLQKKAIIVRSGKLFPDYQLIVKNNRPRINEIIEALMKTKKKITLFQFLEVNLSFIQEIEYGIPPLKEGNKIILGFWPPLKVFANNLGDCDSKAIAFATLWTSYRKFPLILIMIPNHMFIGVAVPSTTGQEFVINGLRYTLFEVTGKEKIPPGIISSYSRFYLERGHYNYQIIK